MTKEERKAYQKEYMKAWKEAHKESEKAKMKAWKEANKDKVKANMKAWKEANKEHYKAYQKEYMKEYRKSDVNANGETKHSIRLKSQRILKQMNLNIPGYQIHHCFGYEDASKFIYCSKELHRKIHQFLRDNNISADKDHWMQIRDLVNSTDEFLYIKD